MRKTVLFRKIIHDPDIFFYLKQPTLWSGVSIGIRGLPLVLALNASTIFNIGVITQVSMAGFSSRGAV